MEKEMINLITLNPMKKISTLITNNILTNLVSYMVLDFQVTLERCSQPS
jgi:hypothetical protein